MIGGLVSEIQSLKRIKYESDLGSNEHYLCSGEIKAGTTFFHHLFVTTRVYPQATPFRPNLLLLSWVFFFFRSHCAEHFLKFYIF